MTSRWSADRVVRSRVPMMDPVTALYMFSHASVSGGFVVALAAICLLQYIVHVHRMTLARRERERWHRELSGVTTELTAARRDRSLSWHENRLLREFLEEADCGRAITTLLGRFIPVPDSDFAFCLRCGSVSSTLEGSLGLSAAPAGGLEIDRVFRQRLIRGEPVVLAGDFLRNSRLWATLPHVDRQKIHELCLFGIAGKDDLLGVFGTTALLPAGNEWPRQLESTSRLLSAVAGSLRDRWRIDSHQDELQSRDEMLSLRSIVDRHFESPLRMIGEFVEQAASKVGADRAVLFLSGRNQTSQFRPLVRCGQALPADSKEQWYRAEDTLAAEAMTLRDPAHYSAADLRRMGMDEPLGTAMLLRIARQERTLGVLMFSRREPQEFSSGQRQLASWSASLLADLIPKIVNHAVVTRQARIDALTQLANRGSFDRRIAEEVQAARAANAPLSLLLFDLDRFKSINDRYGHRAGDAVLRSSAAIVRNCVQNIRVVDRFLGANPFVARYGGEELAVLLPRLNIEAARRVGEAICAAVAQTRVDFDGESIAVTASGGLATIPDHADSVDDLIAAADGALYLAKANGRNRIEVAEGALTAAG